MIQPLPLKKLFVSKRQSTFKLLAFPMPQNKVPAQPRRVLQCPPARSVYWHGKYKALKEITRWLLGFVITIHRMGEKLLAWAGVPIPIDNILADISIYWLTSAFPSGLYPYPFLVTHPDAWNTSTVKPLGYSNFPQEFNFYPKAIAERVYPNLIQYTTLPVVRLPL